MARDPIAPKLVQELAHLLRLSLELVQMLSQRGDDVRVRT
jgi:hypothetical protein